MEIQQNNKCAGVWGAGAKFLAQSFVHLVIASTAWCFLNMEFSRNVRPRLSPVSLDFIQDFTPSFRDNVEYITHQIALHVATNRRGNAALRSWPPVSDAELSVEAANERNELDMVVESA